MEKKIGNSRYVINIVYRQIKNQNVQLKVKYNKKKKSKSLRGGGWWFAHIWCRAVYDEKRALNQRVPLEKTIASNALLFSFSFSLCLFSLFLFFCVSKPSSPCKIWLLFLRMKRDGYTQKHPVYNPSLLKLKKKKYIK